MGLFPNEGGCQLQHIFKNLTYGMGNPANSNFNLKFAGFTVKI
jgi:hypothetical protein